MAIILAFGVVSQLLAMTQNDALSARIKLGLLWTSTLVLFIQPC